MESTYFLFPRQHQLCRRRTSALVNNKYNILSSDDVVSGKLLHVHIGIDGSPVHLINVYAPTNGPERLDLFKTLKLFLNGLNQNLVIVGGDFNCTADPNIDTSTQCRATPTVCNFAF